MKNLLLMIFCLLLGGCFCTEQPEATVFYACASAKDEHGGLYKIACSGNELRIMDFIPEPGLSYLAWSPDRRYLYGTVFGGKEGGVVTWRVDGATLNRVDYSPAGGKISCHLCVSAGGNFLYTANYTDGSITEFKLADGIPTEKRVIPHSGRGATPRQQGPHAHFVGFTPDGRFLAVVDLGTDEVRMYPFDPACGIDTAQVNSVKLPPGSGPRHLVFRPGSDIFYTINELDSTVSTLRYEGNGQAVLLRSIRTLPDDFTGQNYPAAIHLTPDGKRLAVTNRGHDSIAMIELSADGGMKLLECLPCGGSWPCDFAFAKGGAILSANQRANEVHLVGTEHKATVPGAVCIIPEF